MLGKDYKCITNFYWGHEGKRPLESSKHRWENTRMDLREIEWEGVDWMHLAQVKDQWLAFVKMIMNLQVP
jgi:hypothetical protein